MPAFLIPMIIGALITATTSIVGRVIMALGFGVVSYVGLNATIGVFKGYFYNALNSTAYNLAGMAGVLKLDVVLSIFIAAGLARLVISGATSGTLKKFTMK